jgi:murein DD-endopeptidase MepM/ murein hydrolase activator NlpD
LAYLQRGATEAPSPAPAPRPSGLPRAVRPSRATLALLIAGVLLAASALPAGASWPVGSRNSYRSQGYHPGHRANDIAANKGVRVVPMRSGTVVFAGWKSNCGGWQVWLSHGSGLYSAYYHLSRESTSSGRYVRRGESTIGYVGSSGCVTGAHLHLEVWRGYPWRSSSYRVNPWNYIDSGYYLPYRYR